MNPALFSARVYFIKSFQTINNGLTLDFSFDKSKGDNRKELVVVGKEKKNPKILHN